MNRRRKPHGIVSRVECWSIPEPERTAATRYEYHIQVGREASWVGHDLTYAKRIVREEAKLIHARWKESNHLGRYARRKRFDPNTSV